MFLNSAKAKCAKKRLTMDLLMLSAFKSKERKGTLFKCLVVLALER